MAKPGGFIYAVGELGTTSVKIGCTKYSARKRLQQRQRGHPLPLHVLAEVAVASDLLLVERHIHAMLATERQHGEWFDIPIDEPALAALVVRAMHSLVAEQGQRDETAEIWPIQPGSIGERVAEIRRARQLSQQALADRVGMHVQNVCRLEKARLAEINSDTLAKLCVALGISADYLLGLGEDSPGHLVYEASPACEEAP